MKRKRKGGYFLFRFVENTRTVSDELKEKYKLTNPYNRRLVAFDYCACDEENKYCLVQTAAGRGPEEQQPDTFAFLFSEGKAYFEGYKSCKNDEVFWDIDDVRFEADCKEDKASLVELMKEALVVYTKTEYIKAVNVTFPKCV